MLGEVICLLDLRAPGHDVTVDCSHPSLLQCPNLLLGATGIAWILVPVVCSVLESARQVGVLGGIIEPAFAVLAPMRPVAGRKMILFRAQNQRWLHQCYQPKKAYAKF